MSFRLAFTDDFGVDHPKAYWRIVFIGIDLLAPHVRVTFACYHSRDARDLARTPLRARDIFVRGADLAALMASKPSGPTRYASVASPLYEYARTWKDGPPPPEGAEDTRVPFFADARDV